MTKANTIILMDERRRDYYEQLSHKFRYEGVPITKKPADIIIYTDLLFNEDVDIVEIGTHYGGSALFFSSLIKGKIYTFDTAHRWLRYYPKFIDKQICFNSRKSSYRFVVIDDGSHKPADILSYMRIALPEHPFLYLIEDMSAFPKYDYSKVTELLCKNGYVRFHHVLENISSLKGGMFRLK